MTIVVSRAGFTFLEVIACLLVVGLGVGAALALVLYGLMLATKAQGRATGLATALSVAVDPSPLVNPGVPWNLAPGTGNVEGYLNGFYVVRHEDADPLDQGLPSGFSGGSVSVDVYDTFKGRLVTSYSTHVMRQRFQ